MPRVSFEGDAVVVTMSVLDNIVALHGTFHIPLAQVTTAYVSSLKDLELTRRLMGTGMGKIATGGWFDSKGGVVFCDVTGDRDCLVIETRGEQFPKLAFALDDEQDENAIAHEICRRMK